MTALSLLLLLPAAAPAVTATVEKERIVFKAGSELITNYIHGGAVKVEKSDGTKPLAKPYWYPLHAPGGLKVTRDWPMVRGTPGETTDHFHQKSAWFCHGDVIAEGVELKTRTASKEVKGTDFWSEFPGHGRIVCVKVEEPKTIADGVTVTTFNEWQTADGVTILKEARTLGCRVLKNGYLLTMTTKLEPVAKSVTFGDTKEGSFGVRVPDAFRLNGPGKDGVITTSTKLTAKAPAKGTLSLWGQIANWNDYSGTVDGKPCGIAMFADHTNTLESAWHTRDYGLMAANPFGRSHSGFPAMKGKTDLVKLTAGESLELRYAIYMHTGDAAAGNVAAAYSAAFAPQR